MKKKVIKLNDYDDYVKLLKKLNYYKSLFFSKIIFNITGNFKNDEINSIVFALNIKNRKKRIEFIYDKACEMINNKNLDANTCGFENNKCYIQRNVNNGKINGCCRLCLYQSENGCVTQNLTCKLFNCSEVKCRYNVLEYKDISILKLLSFKNRFIIKHDYFSLREDVLKDLYCPSFIYSCFRIFVRLIKNYIILKTRKLTK